MHAGVAGDCLLRFNPVPGTPSGPCSGRGNPIYAQGQCDCWVGYEGQACDVCTPGYRLVNRMCVRTYNSFQGYTIVDKPAVRLLNPKTLSKMSLTATPLCLWDYGVNALLW